MPRNLRSTKEIRVSDEPCSPNPISDVAIPLPPPNNITTVTQDLLMSSCSSSLQTTQNSSQTSLSSTTDIQNLNKKIIKLPSFWIASPEAWFLNAELQFDLHNIIDDPTKYQLVLVALSEDVFCSIIDYIQNPPCSQLYKNIKSILCERYSLSEEMRLKQILSGKDLGEHKPSEFFRDLKNLAGSMTAINSELLYKLWLNRMPEKIQISLAGCDSQSIEYKLKLADSVFNISQNKEQPSITKIDVQVQNSLQQLSELTSDLYTKFEELNLQVNSIFKNQPKIQKRNYISKSNLNKIYCWYHSKYGANAKKCIPPCDFQTPTNTQISHNLN